MRKAEKLGGIYTLYHMPYTVRRAPFALRSALCIEYPVSSIQ